MLELSEYSAAKSNREDGFEGVFGLFLVFPPHIYSKQLLTAKFTPIKGKMSDFGVMLYLSVCVRRVKGEDGWRGGHPPFHLRSPARTLAAGRSING